MTSRTKVQAVKRTPTPKLTKEQKRMRDAVAYLTRYMVSYDKQPLYMEYRYSTYIDDILYGLGASLGREYQMAGGFERFKEVLRKHLEADTARNLRGKK